MKNRLKFGATVLSSLFAFDIAFAGNQPVAAVDEVNNASFSCLARVQKKQEILNKFLAKNKVVIAPLAAVAVYELVIHDKKNRYDSALSYLQKLSAGERDTSITAMMNRGVKAAFVLNASQISTFNQAVDGNKKLCQKIYKSRGSDRRKDRVLVRAYKKVK